MKVYLLILLVLLQSVTYGQTSSRDENMIVARRLFSDQKLADADSLLTVVLDSNADYGEGWDLLVKVRFKEYDEALNTPNIFENVTLTTTTKNKRGKTIKVKNDSLANDMIALLKKINPSKMAYNKLVYATRKATLTTRDAVYASIVLRSLRVDVAVDTNINSKAIASFKAAENEFANKNYNKAAMLYKQATEENPGFYKAQLYLGDCYYATKNYSEAIESFKEAVNKHPDLLEPRKYLADTYGRLGVYDKQLAEIIYTMAIYPDYSNMAKMDEAADMGRKRVNISWTQRGVFPNKITDTTGRDINDYANDNDTLVQDPWVYYVAAYKKIKPYCNEKGLIVKSNPYTNLKYMEVYSWEEMLKNSNDPILDEARRMKQQNYLDCYVLVSCFHNDFYDQYHYFANNNRDKIAEYFKRNIQPK